MLLAQHAVVRGSGLEDDCTGYAAVEERVHQQGLQSTPCNKSTGRKDLEQLSLMGWGKSQPNDL
jgi:hypothetical protein